MNSGGVFTVVSGITFIVRTEESLEDKGKYPEKGLGVFYTQRYHFVEPNITQGSHPISGLGSSSNTPINGVLLIGGDGIRPKYSSGTD